MRRVFFSFKYKRDVWRANVVRNSWVTQGKEAAGFVDAAEFEEIKKRGDAAIRRWIVDQLHGTSVTAVLVGSHTCFSRWVKYEIEQSKERGNGLLGIDISGIKDKDGNTTHCCGRLPNDFYDNSDGFPVDYRYSFYSWTKDNGYDNIGDWIEKAARAVGR